MKVLLRRPMSAESDPFLMMNGELGESNTRVAPLQVELRRRSEHMAPLSWRNMLSTLKGNDEKLAAVPKPRARAVGIPLQTGAGKVREFVPGSALTVMFADVAPEEAPARGQEPVTALCSAIAPVVQGILKFFEPDGGSAQHRAAKQGLDMAPIESSLVQLKMQYGNLRDEVVEHFSTLKRAEDGLQQVREATERNTLEKQELMQALHGVRRKANLWATFTLSMLAISIVIEVALFLHFPMR